VPAVQKSSMRTRKQDKSRQQYRWLKARRACVDAVWVRAGGRCEECGRSVYRLSEARHPMMVGHVHERRSRALGGDALNPSDCVLLCVRDHFNGPSGAHRHSEAKHAINTNIAVETEAKTWDSLVEPAERGNARPTLTTTCRNGGDTAMAIPQSTTVGK